jgi:hypothetical protein
VSVLLSPLVVGTVLALGALAFVLYPIFDDAPPGPDESAGLRTAPEPAAGGAIAALREIEFDRETGKLSDDDYAALKAAYTEDALAAMRAESAAAAGSAPADADLDLAEAVVRKYRLRARSCVTCGPRPEPDAVFCSTCGSYLSGSCEACGAVVSEPGARFCPSCGHSLAA